MNKRQHKGHIPKMKYIRQKLIGIGYIALALIVARLIGEWGCLAYAVPLGLLLLLCLRGRRWVLALDTEQPHRAHTEPTERRSA